VRYSGKERDATGLYHYGYRYYQPWSGRWLSADPAGTVDGLNLFRMCRNNPVTHTDNDGRMTDMEEYMDFQLELAGALLGVNPSSIGAPEASPDALSDTDSTRSVSSDEYDEDGPVTEADRQPYLDLELEHNDLFNDNYIINVPESEDLTLKNVIDVDLDEMRVINASQTGMFLGTIGLGPCIAIGGIGHTQDNQIILGLVHFTGLEEPEEVMSALDDEMREEGAEHIKYIMVGGNIASGGEDNGSLGAERSLLSLRETYDIRSVRLHTSEGELDPITGESTAVDAVLTTTHMLFRKAALY
ncbi:RHS repeat-associated core domain-containing protein, partial [Enterobacter cloacae complex sp. P31C]|uniref:XopAK family type III secretion system effector n=2 Tax=Enterobacter cloacae complex TaxID=354276 RepID=UPI001D02DDFE